MVRKLLCDDDDPELSAMPIEHTRDFITVTVSACRQLLELNANNHSSDSNCAKEELKSFK